ncbi:hypothetical protein Ahy_B08g091297 [Arachis hypogaea]|uniref:Uncharacterized protein n=1 Tax=Arachis hypogaea TaxID=3818 RepID=A0A444Y1W5_ARAHY|nr:hypothetical protein Ahy_B08g091297 [Arachis hypogaea]
MAFLLPTTINKVSPVHMAPIFRLDNITDHVFNFIIKCITNYRLKKKKSIDGCLYALMTTRKEKQSLDCPGLAIGIGSYWFQGSEQKLILSSSSRFVIHGPSLTAVRPQSLAVVRCLPFPKPPFSPSRSLIQLETLSLSRSLAPCSASKNADSWSTAQHSNASVNHAFVGRRGAQHSNTPMPVSAIQLSLLHSAISAFNLYFVDLGTKIQNVKHELERNDVSDEDGEDDDVDAMEDKDIGGWCKLTFRLFQGIVKRAEAKKKLKKMKKKEKNKKTKKKVRSSESDSSESEFAFFSESESEQDSEKATKKKETTLQDN